MKLHTTTLRTIAAGVAVLFAAACGPDERVPGPAPDPAPTPGPGNGQAPVPPVNGDEDRDLVASPSSGTVDTRVTLRGDGFPAGTTLELGFGPPQSEYQVFGSVRTDAEGEFTTTVTPPSWADAGRDYVFVAVGSAGDEVISGRFFVRSGDNAEQGGEMMRVTGVLTDAGVECPALRADSGRLYTLAGDTGEFDTGDRVTVEGTVAEASYCMQGTTISVQDIEPAPGG